MKNMIISLFMLLVANYFCKGQSVPKMNNEDKIRIREAIKLSNQVGHKVWKGIAKVPFVILLITDSVEFLIHHPYPSAEFALSENDTLLNTKILFRKRQFPTGMLATFPAVNGVSCIVVGTAALTGKSTTDWIVTLFHEHFHQYQFTYPDYFASVDKLELSGGDQTGMWQLNYAFPYSDAAIVKQYNSYRDALSTAVSNISNTGFKKTFKKYLKERAKLQQTLSPADYRYFSFQIWQEGIARYTEYKFLKELEGYYPTAEVTKLKDFVPFKEYKEDFYHLQLKKLSDLKLDDDKRLCFYAVGFAEGLLLENRSSQWKEKYLIDKFYIEDYFNKKR
jgi:hypothetical protein